MKPLRRATRMLLVILALILQAGQKNSFQKNGICQTHENVFKGNDSGGGKKEIGVAVQLEILLLLIKAHNRLP